MATTLGKAWNDAGSTPDLTGLSFNELKDSYDGYKTTLDELEARYEASNFKWTVEEQEQYKTALNAAKDVQEEMQARPENLLNERKVLNVPEQVSALSVNLSNLNKGLSIKPAFEDDPRYGYATDNAFLHDVVNAYQTNELSDKLRAVVSNAVGSDEYSAGDWQRGGIFIPEAFLSSIQRITLKKTSCLVA